VLTTLPHIGHFMAALTCGLLVDHVRESKIVSTTTARKLVVYTGAFCVFPILRLQYYNINKNSKFTFPILEPLNIFAYA